MTDEVLSTVTHILPDELIFKILRFCDDETLDLIIGSPQMIKYNNECKKIKDKNVRRYWREIQLKNIENVMKPRMEKHMMATFFGGRTPERAKFNEEWHKSDIELYSTVYDKNIDKVIVDFIKERDRLAESHSCTDIHLAVRPIIFNRIHLISIQSLVPGLSSFDSIDFSYIF